MNRTCKKCGVVKDLGEFAKAGSTFRWVCKACWVARVREWRETNREKARERAKAWRANNREKHRAYAKVWHANNREKAREQDRRRRSEKPDECLSSTLKYKYGIDLDQYNKMLSAQGGACAICLGQPMGGKRLYVDHCHDTKVVRGLLCHFCNVTLGTAKDTPETLESAAAYLRRFKRAA